MFKSLTINTKVSQYFFRINFLIFGAKKSFNLLKYAILQIMRKSYWLMKSEPNVWSIDQQKKAGAKGASWDGVRNYQAANNLKKMQQGDLCFFYHSNIGKEIVGIIEVIEKAFIDTTDKKGRFVAVQVRFKEKLKKTVTLENIKKNKALNHLALIKQSRLSVISVDFKSWKIINKMSKV